MDEEQTLVTYRSHSHARRAATELISGYRWIFEFGSKDAVLEFSASERNGRLPLIDLQKAHLPPNNRGIRCTECSDQVCVLCSSHACALLIMLLEAFNVLQQIKLFSPLPQNKKQKRLYTFCHT